MWSESGILPNISVDTGIVTKYLVAEVTRKLNLPISSMTEMKCPIWEKKPKVTRRQVMTQQNLRWRKWFGILLKGGRQNLWYHEVLTGKWQRIKKSARIRAVSASRI